VVSEPHMLTACPGVETFAELDESAGGCAHFYNDSVRIRAARQARVRAGGNDRGRRMSIVPVSDGPLRCLCGARVSVLKGPQKVSHVAQHETGARWVANAE